MHTSWKAISIMEDDLDKGSAIGLIKFIKRLEKAGLLNRHMLSALCATSIDHAITNRKWNILHELASEA